MKKILILLLFPLTCFSQKKGFHIPETNEYVIVIDEGSTYMKINNDQENFAESFFFSDSNEELKFALSIYKITVEANDANFEQQVEDFYNKDCFECTNRKKTKLEFCNISGVSWEYDKIEDDLVLKGFSFYTQGTYSDYAIIFITLKDKFDDFKSEIENFLNQMIIL